MKYLIDIGHPAHVHYFRNIAGHLAENGHFVLFTCRNKDVTIDLLKQLNFKYIDIGRPFFTVFGKIFGLVYFTLRILIISLKYKPDVYLNATFYSAFVAWLMRKPHLSLEDTFNMEQVKLYLPFTSCVLCGDYEHPHLGKKEIRYSGYQELLYLHPHFFKQDTSVLNDLKIGPDEPYVILRFVSWSASHDLKHIGISEENKIRAVTEFSSYARVFISSEKKIPDALKDYELRILPHRIHDLLAGARFIFGESATMVTEGAMLGVPGIYLDDSGRYYTRDLEERYGLVFNFSEAERDQVKAIEKGIELLKGKYDKEEWIRKQRKMLSEKIKVKDFLTWFIEKWPGSLKLMEENPEYQHRFR